MTPTLETNMTVARCTTMLGPCQMGAPNIGSLMGSPHCWTQARILPLPILTEPQLPAHASIAGGDATWAPVSPSTSCETCVVHYEMGHSEPPMSPQLSSGALGTLSFGQQV